MPLLSLLPLFFPVPIADLEDVEPTTDGARTSATSSAPAGARWRWVDWSGDGRLDALELSASGELALYEQNDAGQLTDRTAFAGLAGRAFGGVDLADLDGDRRLDLVALDEAGAPRLFLQTEDRRFESIAVATDAPAALDGRSFEGLHLVDVQGDGRLDLQLIPAASSVNPRGVLLVHRGDLTFDLVELPALAGAGATSTPVHSARTQSTAPTAASSPALGVGSGALGGVGGTLVCAGAIEDVVTTACIEASSIPQLGFLFPISSEWFVSPTGLVGIGTTTPQARLDVQGVARASRFVSTTGTGQPPFQIASRTLVPLLNADQLDGFDASDFRTSATPITGADVLDESLTQNDLAANSVGASELRSGAVTSTALSTGAVGSAAILDGSVTSADLAASSVGSSKLQDDSVNSFKILDGSIFPPDLSAGAVDTNAIALGAVTAPQLGNGSVTGAKLATASVDASKVVPRSLVGGLLALGTVSGQEITDGTIEGVDLASGAVTSATIAPGAIGSAQLAASSVNSSKVANRSLTGADIAVDSITSNELANDSVGAAELAVGAVTSASILDSSIRSVDLADGSIDSAALAPGAVDSSALAAGAVGTAALSAGAVTGSRVLDASLDGGDLAVGAIGAREIANGSIGNQEIGAGASIAGTKIDPDFGGQDVVSTGTAVFGDPAGQRAELAPFGAGLRVVGAPLAGEFFGNVTMSASANGVEALDVTHSEGDTAATVRLEDPANSSTAPALHVVATGNGAARGVLVESLGLGNTGSAFQVIHHGAGPGLDITSGAVPLRVDRSINAGSIIEGRNLSDVEFRVDSSGDVFCDGAFVGGGADYAEWLPHADLNEVLEPGDVVAVRGGRVSRALAGADRFMVVSTSPCVIGNHPDAELDAPEAHSPIAFVGQVPVKVRGPVRVGDVLVPSGLGDGHARAIPPAALTSNELARMIGTAWSATLDGTAPEAPGQVIALVGAGEAGAAATALARLEAQLAERDALLLDLARRVEALERR